MKRNMKRNFVEIRRILLEHLAEGKTTINELSKKSGVNWKTASKHLIFLVGKGLARIVIDTEYVKIYELSDKGKEILENN